MQWTTQRKIFVGVLAVAGGAFVIDRLFLGNSGGAAPASADTAPPGDAAPAAAPGVVAGMAPAAAPASSASAAAARNADTKSAPRHVEVANLLDSVAANQSVTSEPPVDAFRLASAWAEQEARATAANAPAAKPEPLAARIDAAGEFTRHHTLAAVMVNARGSLAIIDDERVGLGQSIDGWKLVAVGERSATLEQNGVRAELRIEAPVLQRSSRPVIGTQPAIPD